MNLPILEVKTYVTPDGKKIEEHKNTGTFYTIDSPEDFPDIEEIFYIGVATAQTQIGEQSIQFPIENASTLKEAFEQYENALKTIIEENQNQIITASENDFNGLGNSGLIL